MKRVTLIGGIAALAILGTGVAATAKGMGGERGKGQRPDPVSFEELDTDGNGLITLEEIQAQAQNRFASADANGDGLLSADELAAKANERVKKRVDRMIERFDENDDGMLSAEEMPKPRGKGDRGERMISHLDEDGDGAISKEEFEKAKKKRWGKKGPRKDRDEG